jgi:hypothetical protein
MSARKQAAAICSTANTAQATDFMANLVFTHGHGLETGVVCLNGGEGAAGLPLRRQIRNAATNTNTTPSQTKAVWPGSKSIATQGTKKPNPSAPQATGVNNTVEIVAAISAAKSRCLIDARTARLRHKRNSKMNPQIGYANRTHISTDFIGIGS